MADKELEKKIALQKLIAEVADPFLKKEVREAIVKLVIEHTEENGSCRVGWAAEQIIGKPQQNHVHDKIAGLVTKSGKYIKERNEHFSKDWNIYFNPNYELSEITKKTSLLQRKALIITIILSILTLVFSGLNYNLSWKNQTNQKKLQEQFNNLKLPTIQIDSVIVKPK